MTGTSPKALLPSSPSRRRPSTGAATYLPASSPATRRRTTTTTSTTTTKTPSEGRHHKGPHRPRHHRIVSRTRTAGSGASSIIISTSGVVAPRGTRSTASVAAAAAVRRAAAGLLLLLWAAATFAVAATSLLGTRGVPSGAGGIETMPSRGWLWGGGGGRRRPTLGGAFVSAFVVVPSPPASLTTRRVASPVHRCLYQTHRHLQQHPQQQQQQQRSLAHAATTAPLSWTIRPQRGSFAQQPQQRRRPSLAMFSSSSASSNEGGVAVSSSTAGPLAAETPAATRSAPPGSPAPRIKTVHCTNALVGRTITVKGWVRTVRQQKTLTFLNVNDGSSVAGLQVVVNLDVLLDESSQKDVSALTTGAAVSIVGRVVESPKKESQSVELQATSVALVGPCPSDSYPLAKKKHSLEYLRSIAHLRPRTNTIAAVARVRSQLAFAIHQFFQSQGFVYVHTPLITASDCEGAGEMFRVTTLDLNHVDRLPRPKGPDGVLAASVDYSKDFFGKPAYLTVSGQLGGETHACALGDIYTFGPTFRAENSQTTRHLAEFHMVEPELAFCDLAGAMDNAEQLVKSVVTYVLDNSHEDLQFFQKFFDPNLVQRLTDLVREPFVRIPYREAIQYLQDEIRNDPTKWKYPDVKFGTDLATEHERWLAETKFNTAVFVYNYPKQIKAFYMRDNDDNDSDDHQGRTVAAMDLLLPGVGELIGGSQREDRLDVLETKLEEQGLSADDYWWYLDLRRYGSVPHAGYGLGFERLVTYVTGIDNIREAIAFPRYPGNAEF